MSKIKLANELKRLLPGQENSRIRQAIMEAYQRATGAPSLNPEYYQTNITNLVQNIITEVVGVVSPDGIIVYGGVDQDGNDLTFDTEWQWRRNGVAYKLIEETTISIPPTAVGYTRTDIIAGTISGTFIRVAGTPVELPTVPAPPTIPANTIPIISVDVSDIGITNFIEFALSSFVRFDVNDQDLNPVQRQNARTNIQAVGKDVDDSITSGRWRWLDWENRNKMEWFRGTGTANGSALTFYNAAGERVIRFYTETPQANLNNQFPTFLVRGVGANTRALVTWLDGNGEPVFGMTTNGVNQFKTASIQPRSTSANTSIRRDELPLYYHMTIVDNGQLDNIVLEPDTKLLVFTNADDLTGIEMEANRKLLIFNNTGGNLTIHAESASSIAANRFATGTVIPNQGFQEVIKIGTRIRLK